MRKAQVTIVGFTLVTLIMLITVSISFVWGRDLIEKSASITDLRRVEDQMIELHNAIKEVANERSQRTVNFDINDGWLFVSRDSLSNSTIRFETFSNLPNPVKFNNQRIILGNHTDAGPCKNASTNLGRLGFDEPACLIQRGGIFELKYIILNDTTNNECFGILVEPGENVAATKGDHRILLTFNNTRAGSDTNCTSTSYSVVKIDIN